MKNEVKKGIVVFLIMTMLLSGCSGGNGQSKEIAEGDGSNNSASVSTVEKNEDSKESEKDENAGTADTASKEQTAEEEITEKENAENTGDSDNIAGKWVLVYTAYHSEYGGGQTDDSVLMAQDDGGVEASFDIQEKDGKYITNHKKDAYESRIRIYGNELVRYDEPAYEGCENKDWCYGFSDAEDDELIQEKITRIDDTLIAVSEYSYEDEEYSYKSRTIEYYLKEDSEKLKNPEELRYFETVSVDDAEELLNEIGNNKKIILKSGIYDMSVIPHQAVANGYVQFDSYIYKICNVSNLAIEAEEGADVQIVCREPHYPVLTFDSCSYLRLSGLTVGHDVEPGYCSGSVLYFREAGDIVIDKCKLYGSGTYGIEAYSSYGFTVTDSEIYECTYGIMSLKSCGTLLFKDCKFHNCEDMSMIWISSVYSLSFEDCEFKENIISSSISYFVEMTEYDDVTFKNCTFKSNEYNVFSNYNVVMDNCTVDDKESVSGAIITMADINNSVDIKNLYDKAMIKQTELEKKINGDSSLDQQTLNSLSYEKFYLWDALINKIWSYLGNTLDEEEMTKLTEEQRKWINDKQAAAQDAARPFEGGSMELMVEYGVEAEWTQKRVEYLIDKYLNEN